MRHEVTDADTAAALGSGDVPVLGTPRLIAWMEAATVQAAAASLNPGQTTVGTSIRIEHRRATWWETASRSPQLHRGAVVAC
jgi:predicted thioesterase